MEEGKEKSFVERRDEISRRRRGGAGSMKSREEETMSVEEVFGMVLDIQGKVWCDLAG